MSRWIDIRRFSTKANGIYVVFTDGACRGNPGVGGAGAVLYNSEGTRIGQASRFLGHSTNNVCEYEGALLGLALAKKYSVKQITIKTDSLLLHNQVKGIYRVKSPPLIELMKTLKLEMQDFDTVDIEHVRREFNKTADALANQAIDKSNTE